MIDLSEIDIKSIPIEVLRKTEAKKWKWICKAQGCNRYTTIKDFEIFPLFFYRKTWINIYRSYFLCAIHWKLKGQKLTLKSMEPFINYDNFIIS
jgi:hypothetical protein